MFNNEFHCEHIPGFCAVTNVIKVADIVKSVYIYRLLVSNGDIYSFIA